MRAFLSKLHDVFRNWRSMLGTAYFRLIMARLGENSLMGEPSFVINPKNVSIGANTFIADHVELIAHDKITIGDCVRISRGVRILTSSLIYTDKELPLRRHTYAPVVVERGAWLATNAVIMPGVTVGERAVVMAGAVVTENVPPYTMVGGVPAREIRKVELLD
jgi:acetyltransferase-like isoleucine patch superfamily enzyme